MPTWRALAPSPLGSRFGAVSLWTGTELIVGCGYDGNDMHTCDSARHDLAGDRWSTMSIPAALDGPTDEAGFGIVSAVWTGSRMFAAGPDYAGLYDPATDTWTAVDPRPTRGRIGPGLAWTGTAVFAFAEGGALFLSEHRALDTDLDGEAASSPLFADHGVDRSRGAGLGRQHRQPHPPGPTGWRALRPEHRHVDPDGADRLAPGGGVERRPRLDRLGAPALGRRLRTRNPAGAAHDPARDTWRPIGSVGAPPGRGTLGFGWTGAELLVWGGWDPTQRFSRTATGGLYDPAQDTWRPIPSVAGAPEPRSGFAYAWTGSEFLV